MSLGRILIVDDDESIRKVLGYILEDAGYEVDKAASPDDALGAITATRPDLVLSDIRMPGKDGIALMDDIRTLDATIPIVILTAFGTVETAVEAMKKGAADYLTKPISRDELTLTVAKALKLRRLEEENADLRDTLRERFRFENIVGLSSAMKGVFDAMGRIASSDVTALIVGESGTGKELVARAIHFNSPRRAGRLVTVNCAAIPSELLESELFGHVRGAFTGAVRDKQGKFELAHGGTLFLDEVGSMPLELQPKLLRALQEREIERVGGERAIPVDVRVVAATNQPLATLIEHGRFREDLYYRLSVVPIHLPPLRERKSDIPLLVRHFVAKHASVSGVAFAPDALAALSEYDWPGNVRELENFCERALIMRASDTIDAGAVRAQLEAIARENPSARVAGRQTLPEMERQAVLDALRAADWNQSAAARILGVPRHVLLYRLKKFGIDPRRPG